jgi:hypothetical protein
MNVAVCYAATLIYEMSKLHYTFELMYSDAAKARAQLARDHAELQKRALKPLK